MTLNKYVKNGVVLLVVAGLGYTTGRYMQPAEVIVKTEIKEVEKVRVDTKTRIIYRKMPDGTVERITEEETKSSSETGKDTRTEQITKAKKSSSIAIVALTSTDFDFSKPEYALHVQTNVLGPLKLGIYGSTNKQVGISIGLDF